MAARQAQPDDARGAAQRHRHLGRAGAGRAARAAPRGDGLQARRSPTAARCSSASAWAEVAARRQGRARRRRRLAGSPLSLDYPSMSGQVKVGDRGGPVPQGRARARRACSACSACSRCRAGWRSTSATCSRGLRLRQRHAATSTIGQGMAAHQQPAHARRRGGGADGRQRRHRARDAGPARGRRARDQRRHRVARLRGRSTRRSAWAPSSRSTSCASR